MGILRCGPQNPAPARLPHTGLGREILDRAKTRCPECSGAEKSALPVSIDRDD
jgi:hypothetical protein